MGKNKTCKRCNVLGLACRRHQYSVQAKFRSWKEADTWMRNKQYYDLENWYRMVQRDGWYVVESLKKKESV